MPLQDHFHPPLSLRRPWTSFHNSWATYISADVNRRLPEGYFAVANVQFGIEIDVATFNEHSGGPGVGDTQGEWAPSAPALTVPLGVITDVVEVQVFGGVDGPTLAGAIELVSPSNKNRPAEREAFVAKCASYLHQGVGLVMVDNVTTRRANLHEALLVCLGASTEIALTENLYATAYHPVQHGDETSVDVWQEALTLGEPLPTLSLWLRGGPCIKIELEATYERTRQEQRISVNGA